MTLWYVLLFVLGVVSFIALQVAYYAILRRYVLSLFRKFVLHFIFLVLTMLVPLVLMLIAGLSASGDVSSSSIIPAKDVLQFLAIGGGIFLAFVVLVSTGDWVLDLVALKRGVSFKQRARQARDAGNNEEADRYDKKYWDAIFRIRIYGRAKEIEEIENAERTPRVT